MPTHNPEKLYRGLNSQWNRLPRFKVLASNKSQHHRSQQKGRYKTFRQRLCSNRWSITDRPEHQNEPPWFQRPCRILCSAIRGHCWSRWRWTLSLLWCHWCSCNLQGARQRVNDWSEALNGKLHSAELQLGHSPRRGVRSWYLFKPYHQESESQYCSRRRGLGLNQD